MTLMYPTILLLLAEFHPRCLQFFKSSKLLPTYHRAFAHVVPSAIPTFYFISSCSCFEAQPGCLISLK